jgi:hypothetical protein
MLSGMESVLENASPLKTSTDADLAGTVVLPSAERVTAMAAPTFTPTPRLRLSVARSTTNRQERSAQSLVAIDSGKSISDAMRLGRSIPLILMPQKPYVEAGKSKFWVKENAYSLKTPREVSRKNGNNVPVFPEAVAEYADDK